MKKINEIKKNYYVKIDCLHPSLYIFYDTKEGYYIDYQPSESKEKNVKFIIYQLLINLIFIIF